MLGLSPIAGAPIAAPIFVAPQASSPAVALKGSVVDGVPGRFGYTNPEAGQRKPKIKRTPKTLRIGRGDEPQVSPAPELVKGGQADKSETSAKRIKVRGRAELETATASKEAAVGQRDKLIVAPTSKQEKRDPELANLAHMLEHIEKVAADDEVAMKFILALAA